MTEIQSNQTSKFAAYNEAVRTAYFKIVASTEALLATVDDDSFRRTLSVVDDAGIDFFKKVHELITPMFYLSLRCDDGETLTINYEYGQRNHWEDYSAIYGRFVRNIYECTSKSNTVVDIEAAVVAGEGISICGDIFDSVVNANHNYSYQTIAYKSTL